MDSIRAAIVRLESQSGQTPTVAALRDVLKRHEERALGQTPDYGTQRRR
jgi:hypothetical protein